MPGACDGAADVTGPPHAIVAAPAAEGLHQLQHIEHGTPEAGAVNIGIPGVHGVSLPPVMPMAAATHGAVEGFGP